jgi:hypothetical protein
LAVAASRVRGRGTKGDEDARERAGSVRVVERGGERRGMRDNSNNIVY